jgi:hypothetical protein
MRGFAIPARRDGSAVIRGKRAAAACDILINVMAIPNVKRYRISSPDGAQTATLMAVLPKDIDVNKYLSEASQRFDWKAYAEAQQKQFKVRVGQQKQKKAK